MSRVTLLIKGKNPKYLINEIIKNKIEIYNFNIINNSYYLTINLKDLKTIKEIKTTCKITIIKRFGPIKYIHIIKNNKKKTILIIFFLFILILLSKITFNIKVDTTNKNIKEIILNDLNEFGLKKYKFKISDDKKVLIKNKILEKEKDKIEWLEIEENKNTYIIKLLERKTNNNDKCIVRNLISSKNAIIRKINSSSGEIIVKKDDYVVKGQILVSGIIHNKEEIVNKVCVSGKVYGETWYKVKESIPLYSYNYKKDKKVHKKLEINILNILNNTSTLKINKINEYNIIDSKIIPIRISLIKYQKLKQVKIKKDINKIDKYSLSLAEKQLLKKLDKDSRVLDKKVLKKSLKNSKIEVEIFLAVEENITSYTDIVENNEE